MAKLIIGTNRDEVEGVARGVADSFHRTAQVDGDFGSAVAFGKLGIPTQNIFCCEDGFAIGIGTYIYEGQLDSNALQKIYDVFSGNVRELQERVIGNYALAIWKQGKLVVFVDPNAIQDLYYLIDDESALICNSLYHLGKASESPALNSYAMIQQLFQLCVVGNESLLEGVLRLDGNHAIFFDDGLWTIDALPHLDMAVKGDASLSAAIIERFSSIKDSFAMPAVAMTGGQDSRLALSALLGAGLKPGLVYWRGNSISTNTKEQDYECVQQIAVRCGLDVEEWDATDSSRERYPMALAAFGEYTYLYGYNENLMRSLMETKRDFITFGYFGEMFRNAEEIQAYERESFSIDELFDDLYLRGSYKEIFPGYEAYRAHIVELLADTCDRLEIDKDNLSKSDFQHINTEVYRKRADIHMANFANQFIYSFLVLGDRMLTDTTNRWGYAKRVGSRPALGTIQELTPALLEIPFYSHIRKMRVDPQSLTLCEENPVRTKIKQRLQSNKKSAWYYPLARKIYHLLNHDKKSLEEIGREGDMRKPYLSALKNADILAPVDRGALGQLELDSNILQKIYQFEIMWQEIKKD
ncbi:MAG: hypothetical protein V8R08_06780 [Coriobacteriales bacterium]